MKFEILVLRLLLAIFKRGFPVPRREDSQRLIDEVEKFISQPAQRGR